MEWHVILFQNISISPMNIETRHSNILYSLSVDSCYCGCYCQWSWPYSHEYQLPIKYLNLNIRRSQDVSIIQKQNFCTRLLGKWNEISSDWHHLWRESWELRQYGKQVTWKTMFHSSGNGSGNITVTSVGHRIVSAVLEWHYYSCWNSHVTVPTKHQHCAVCGKCVQKLNLHMKMHTGEKQYHCSVCGQWFI